ncbi:hypothetical protein PVT68_11060 [Microbulbifer bruguierae]|uniref:SURF1-like protein n=1 Tax=Microbulbifer bruguierae TaxID=3029061 RepID=A0ABY8N8U0_9GAMM|nr:SURF1 family protein [Microbulbifer bruguierae]WGL15308.1 hypothetical protein PVT68_11060 [Microbulbifer bruguierae]
MTAPNRSPTEYDDAFVTGTGIVSTKNREPSRETSVAFIRNWPLTILCLCLLPALIVLGNWQLYRAGQKQQILDDIDARLAAQPKKIDQIQELKTYIPVRLTGFYTDEFFYLDNRTRNGRVGYEILQVFETGNSSQGEARWLINRGWLPAGSDRTKVPAVAYPLAAKVITGFLYPSITNDQAQTRQVRLAPHSRIQQLGPSFNESLNLNHASWHIRLSADSDTAFLTNWQLVNIRPQKHIAYAVQWFSMAVALLVLWLLAATNLKQIVREKWFKRPSERT